MSLRVLVSLALLLLAQKGGVTVCWALRLPSPLQGKTFAKALATFSTLATLALPLPATALFDNPTAALNLAEKSANYGRLADVGIGPFLVKDGPQLLRLATPTSSKAKFIDQAKADNDPAHKIAEDVELVKIRLEQVGTTNKPAWQGGAADLADATNLLQRQRATLLSDSADPAKAASELSAFEATLTELSGVVRVADYNAMLPLQAKAANTFQSYLQARLPPKQLPYTLPSEYSALPKLLGRATVEVTVKKAKGVFKSPDLSTSDKATFTVVVDGYTHPITAGNFVDLVSKGQYDGAPLGDEELIVQTKVSALMARLRVWVGRPRALCGFGADRGMAWTGGEKG